jgi:hypothetical protein
VRDATDDAADGDHCCECRRGARAGSAVVLAAATTLAGAMAFVLVLLAVRDAGGRRGRDGSGR